MAGKSLQSPVTLSQTETRLRDTIEARRGALLDDLRLHVELPTGGFNSAALDETRSRFIERLEALGATTELVPGDAKPDWLPGGSGDNAPPVTAICRRPQAESTPKSVLIAGHLDTVHDPEGDFRELHIAPDGTTATGPGCVDMKGGLVIAMAALEAL